MLRWLFKSDLYVERYLERDWNFQLRDKQCDCNAYLSRSDNSVEQSEQQKIWSWLKSPYLLLYLNVMQFSLYDLSFYKTFIWTFELNA